MAFVEAAGSMAAPDVGLSATRTTNHAARDAHGRRLQMNAPHRIRRRSAMLVINSEMRKGIPQTYGLIEGGAANTPDVMPKNSVI